MKVTISFNGTKIVVPCGDGEITVRELTALAATRYKKAIGKHFVDYWVSVHSLKSEEGGMLDPDDMICDVADDREQLQAIFDEQKGVGHGDGMSSDSDHSAGTERVAKQAAQFHKLAGPHPDAPFGASAGLPAEAVMDTMHAPPHQLQVQSHAFQSHSQALDSFDAKCSLNVLRRRDPLGASANKPDKKPVMELPGTKQQQQQQQQQQMVVRPSVEIVIPNEIGPLGIHVLPCDDDGRLIVRGIEPGGRVDRDGRLAVNDEIIEINAYPLTTVSFNKAQEIFKEALFAKELRLQVVKGLPDSTVSAGGPAGGENKENVLDSSGSAGPGGGPAPSAPAAPSPPAGARVTSAFQANNTRKIGDVFSVSLRKGPSGLGFTLTTRDNAPGGVKPPIYIKTIMPKGAAIEDGRLQPGDRLLKANDHDLAGMSQAEVVQMLRNAKTNDVIELCVSRHAVGGQTGSFRDKMPQTPSGTSLEAKKHPEAPQPQPQPQPTAAAARANPTIDDPEPRSLSPATSHYESYDSSESGLQGQKQGQFPWKERQILTFDIPVHDSERAGLGVSVKGKTTSNADGTGVTDLGIFVKSVLNGGAASRDGRLNNNDQLVNINGLSLLGKPNPQAMETLRKAMHEEGPMPGIISLTVARKRKSDDSAQAPVAMEQDNQSPEHVFSDEQKRLSMSSVVTSSSDDLVREYHVSQPRFVAPIAPPPPRTGLQQLQGTRNPVIDRLMGKDSAGIVPSNIRNDSYYMATHHDTWNASMMQQQHQQPLPGGPPPGLECPTVHQAGPEGVMIEQEAAQTPTDSVDTTTGRESLTSLVDVTATPTGFSRDQPGRQSMSEKRHATLDAKATDTYQKRKKARDDMLKKAQEAQQVVWKKSASVESLHTAGATDILTEEERLALKNSYVRANSVRVSRARGTNESFRQAVDRSYEHAATSSETDPSPVAGLTDPGEVRLRPGAFEPKSEKKKGHRSSKLMRGFGAMFRLSKAQSSSSHSSSSLLPQSQSVPDYTVLQQQQQSQQQQRLPEAAATTPTYDYLPNAMMRPGSRVGIAESGTHSAHSDYEVIQRHLHRNRVQQQQHQYTGRSHSNPSRHQARPKSNFYEYDFYAGHPPAQEKMDTYVAGPPHTGLAPNSGMSADPYYHMGPAAPAPKKNPHQIHRYSPQEPVYHQSRHPVQHQPHHMAQTQPTAGYHYQQHAYGEIGPPTHYSLPRGSK